MSVSLTKCRSVTLTQRAWEGGKEREGVNVVIKDSILLLVSGSQQRVQWVRADQRDHVNNTASTEWAAPLSPASSACLLLSLCPPVFSLSHCSSLFSVLLGFISYFISHSTLSFSPLSRNTSFSLAFSLSLSLPVSVFLSVLSILQTKSTVTVSAITQQTKIYLTENVCKKCILHLQDVLILLFISFSSMYILSAWRKKKRLATTFLCFGLFLRTC